jgi:hypothetical protein
LQDRGPAELQLGFGVHVKPVEARRPEGQSDVNETGKSAMCKTVDARLYLHAHTYCPAYFIFLKISIFNNLFILHLFILSCIQIT